MTSTQSPFIVLDSILYIIAFILIIWYIRWWWRTTTQIRDTMDNNTKTRIERNKLIKQIGNEKLFKQSRQIEQFTEDGDKKKEADNLEFCERYADRLQLTGDKRADFITRCIKRQTTEFTPDTDKLGTASKMPEKNGPYNYDKSDLLEQIIYSKKCYSQPINPGIYQQIPKLGIENVDDPSIDEQATDGYNGLDVTQNRLPSLMTPPKGDAGLGPQTDELGWQPDRRYRNRDQQLRMIADDVQDKTRLSESDYAAKYAWHDEPSRCLRLPPGFGKLTPRKTADGSRYEYAYTGDIRDAQTRTPMQILADYPRKEWNCQRPYYRCTVPAKLIGNAPEYYRRLNKRLEAKEIGEQWQQSVNAQLSPQTMPPVYPG